MAKTPRLAAMTADFLRAFARLPPPQQHRVKTLIPLLQARRETWPAELRVKPVPGALDADMHALRIDRGYRAILYAPAHSRTCVLLWADTKAAAARWAARRLCRVHPDTGALQVFEPQPDPAPAVGGDAGDAGRGAGAFDQASDRDLARIGVPAAMLAEVRGVGSVADLDALQPRLPAEACDALACYLAGEPYEAIVRERGAPPAAVDPADLAAALARDDSRAGFAVLDDDDAALAAMLEAPLERWRVFLHPAQRRLVERDWDGPVRVLGGAGTGKTVAALHRARWLARTLPPPGRILFTTFARNLAADITQQLRAICTPAEAARIEVTNIDRWAVRFLGSQHYPFSIIYRRDQAAWALALERRPTRPDLPERFYRDEWELVVQPWGLTTAEAYRRDPRTGRGVTLRPAERDAVWPVFEAYRAELARRQLKEAGDACRDAAALIARADRAAHRYAAVVVDEAQDLDPPACRLLRALVPPGPNDLFIVGDGHQRLYSRTPAGLARCGIDIGDRSRTLRRPYRTTEQTRRWAARLLDGCTIDDLDGGRDDAAVLPSATRGPEPRVERFDTRAAQADALVRYLTAHRDGGGALRGVCVTARIKAECDRLHAELQAGGLPVHRLGPDADDPAADGVRLATMHRVKGLEFDRVVIASANDGLLPLRGELDRAAGDAERTAAELRERALVYVAATRAKRELLVLSFGAPSPFLPRA